MEETKKNLFVSLSFEKTFLPPFEDILILGQECPLGMNGVGECLDLLVPDGFDRVEVSDEHVGAIIINKNILRRVDVQKIKDILKKRVFPFVGSREIIKVDFKTKVSYDSFLVEE
jgi:hypothetical protein